MPGVSDAGTWDGANQSGLNSGGGSPVHGTDPDTGITGIKFDEGFEEGETRYYYFIVDGNYAQDSSVVIASKGGNDYDTATITGPSPYCEIYVPPSTQIDVEKYINGEDADVAPGVELVEGDEVTFSFEVNNTGNVELTNVIVGDDKLGIICQIALLKAGETVACMKTSVAIAEQYTNLGKAATYYGGPPKAGGILVRDADRGYYFGQ